MLSAALPSPPERLRFDHFEVRLDERRLFLDGAPAVLGGRAFDLLEVLIARRERLVSKAELLELVWPGLVVEENNLHVHVSALRKLLGAQAIATVPGRGYRFTPRALADGSPAPAPAAVPAPVPVPPKLRTNLPALPAPLIGRDEELASLDGLVERHRFVTVVGAGGIGKSRLVQALLHERRQRHAHGVCWVEIAPGADAAVLTGAIASALGVGTGQGADPLAGLLAAVEPLDQLVALDGAETVLADVARIAQALHDAAPELRLVVTSQAPLRVAAEHTYRLGAMAWPDAAASAQSAGRFAAVALFVARAQAADLRFRLTDANVGAVVALCRALDGLPLAIELAAARVAMLGVQGLLASLHQRLHLLTRSPDRSAPERQRTLRATLEWSHALLGANEQAVFRRLAVLAGGASLDAGQQIVCDAQGDLDEWAVLDALATLVDRSLLDVLATDDELTLPRYRLLDSPRAYALECLDRAGETAALRARHAAVFAARCDELWAATWEGRAGVDAWRRAFEPDIDNAREAFAWARERGGAATAVTIGTTLILALPLSSRIERMALADALETLEPAVGEDLRLRVAVAVCSALRTTWPQRLLATAARALTLARDTGDPFGLYFALSKRAIAASLLGDKTGCDTTLAEMRAVEDPGWPPQRLIFGADAEYFAARVGDPVAGLRLARRQLALTRAAGGAGWLAMNNLIDAELQAGDAQAAVRTGLAVVAQLQGTRGESDLAFCRLNLAAAWLALDDTVRARETMRAGWQQAPRFDLQRYWADFLSLLAAIEGRPQAAARLIGYADAGYARRASPRQPSEAQAMGRAATLAYAALGEVEFERMRAEGAGLRDADVEGIAFATD